MSPPTFWKEALARSSDLVQLLGVGKKKRRGVLLWGRERTPASHGRSDVDSSMKGKKRREPIASAGSRSMQREVDNRGNQHRSGRV